jgi:hypothetical protein
VRIARREHYSSPNSDRWYLARDTEAGRVFIMHEPNAALGGKNAEIELGSFFNRSDHGPEHQELVRLIASLIDDPATPTRPSIGPVVSCASSVVWLAARP